MQIHFQYRRFAHLTLRFCLLFDGFCFGKTLCTDTFRFLFHCKTDCFCLCFSGFGFLNCFVFLRFCITLTANQIGFCLFFCLILHSVSLLADFCIQLFLFKGNFLFCQLSFLFTTGNIRIGTGNLNRFTLVFLLNRISSVCLCLFGICHDLHFSLLDKQLSVLLGNLLFSFDLDGVGLLLCLRGCNGNIALCVGLGNLCVFTDLFDIVDTHIFNGTGIVLKVLNIEVDNLNAQLLHIRNNVFGNLFRDALTVLNHLFQSDRTDDFTHVAFQHLGHQVNQVNLFHSQQRLCGPFQQLRIRRDFDVRNAIDRNVDKLIGRNSVCRLDIHLHDPQ